MGTIFLPKMPRGSHVLVLCTCPGSHQTCLAGVMEAPTCIAQEGCAHRGRYVGKTGAIPGLGTNGPGLQEAEKGVDWEPRELHATQEADATP